MTMLPYDKFKEKCAAQRALVARLSAKMSVREVALKLNLSTQRVYQILKAEQEKAKAAQ